MKKSLVITAVRPILTIERPIVVFEVAGHPALVRNPKQALADLQNSGRALQVNASAFAGGYHSADGLSKSLLQEALFACVGAQVTADIIEYKAGDEYEVTANHPAITDKNHEFYNKVKVGGKLKAKEDGIRIEGFMQIPLTPAEMLRKELAQAGAVTMLQMFGITPPAMVNIPTAEIAQDAFSDLPQEPAVTEAIGKAGSK